MEKFDVIIIGAGQAGNPLSSAFAEAGKRTALIEEKYVGGTCINYGCTPTKTMIASAEVAYMARRSEEYGVHLEDVRVDLKQVRQRKEAVVTSFRGGSEQRIVAAGVNLIYGKAMFTGNKTLEVTTPKGEIIALTAETIIINAGGETKPTEYCWITRSSLSGFHFHHGTGGCPRTLGYYWWGIHCA